MTAEERKQAEEIYGNLCQSYIMELDRSEIVYMAMESYAALKVAEATKEMYPKEFVEWNDNLKDTGTIFHNLDGLYSLGDCDLTLDELFEYWKQNIRK